MNDHSPNAGRNPLYPLARLSPAKDKLLALEITLESVDRCDIRPMVEKLELLSDSPEMALHWEGKVAFCFAGWDRDRQETAEILEIRTYFAALTDARLYWLHYVEKVGDTFPRVLRLLCAGHAERVVAGQAGWRFEDLREVTKTGLVDCVPESIRYQLLHRTVSAIIEAQRFNATHAVMLIHSFIQSSEWYQDYAAFDRLMGGDPLKNALISVGARAGIQLHLAWVQGNARYLSS